MGQEQSKTVDTPVQDSKTEDSNSPSTEKSPPSMESLLEEATAFGNEDESASLEAKAQKALDCPCIQDLKSGPCGSQFTEAFKCFLMSTAEEKGSDCVQPFVALQKCIQINPDAFSKDVLEDDEAEAHEKETKSEKPVEDYKIIPPRWALESPSPKPKL
ncbi:mitochondrial intermembrane space import and assembly protein 40 homolog [Rutidosis leptorrhynchoides]|uniref:mitochondrial intermembrane space import and assembly protein 40 homolog n=1 Tax=Rutidosis leptorrhynchoides TaxID=125765 RepID=UPI003A99EA90